MVAKKLFRVRQDFMSLVLCWTVGQFSFSLLILQCLPTLILAELVPKDKDTKACYQKYEFNQVNVDSWEYSMEFQSRRRETKTF